MGRRRRRVIKQTRKQIPTIFACPFCGQETIRITPSKKADKALARCTHCGAKGEVNMEPPNQPVDLYNRFMDQYYWNSSTPQAQPEQRNEQVSEQMSEQEANTDI